VIVEIGSQFGMSASLFALATNADIVCIEIDDNAPFMQNLELAELDMWVHPIFEDSRQIDWAKIVTDLSIDIRIDLLFVDGDHSYEGALNDLVKFSKYVNYGGIIAVHDCACATNKNPHSSHHVVYAAVQNWLSQIGSEQGFRFMFSVDSTMVFRRM
jgi:predicted O-methyltransferase YrrM